MNQAYDPRTGQPVGVAVADTPQAGVERIATAAAAAFPLWAQASREQRAQVLECIADALQAEAPLLAQVADAETALGLPRLTGEVQRTSGQLRLFAQVVREGGYLEAILDSPAPDNTPPRPDLRRMLQPLGPVLVFGASNFPFAFSAFGGDTASALAAGCPIVAKAHPAQPGTAEATAAVVARALQAAAAPAGLFALVHGTEAGTRLIRDPAIKAVGFTGSTAGGRRLFDLANARPDPIPFYGELGSVNPAVVLPVAAERRGDEIARGYAGSLTLGVGQFCTNPGLLFAPRALLPRLAEEMARSQGGPMLTAGIRQAYDAGAAMLAGHAEILATGQAGTQAATPQLFAIDLPRFATDVERYTEEHFGPLGLVVAYDSPSELEPLLERLPGSLVVSVHAEAEEAAAAQRLLAVLGRSCGRLVYNAWPTGVAVSWSMHHGGPWPATTNPLHTSVGATAIRRWLAPICYQDWPDELLPAELQDANPLGIPRRRDGVLVSR